MLTPDSMRSRLIKAGVCSAQEIKGCSAEELKQIEQAFGGRIPKAYINVMRVIGKGAGEFASDVQMFFPEVLSLTKDTRNRLAEEGIELPADACVFANRYGEQILFFRLQNSEEDPPVYKWHDEEPEKFEIVLPSIWSFIEEELSVFEG